jgi:hypothetical protein
MRLLASGSFVINERLLCMCFAGKNLDDPLIDALVCELGLHRNRSVQNGIQAQAQLAGVGLLRWLVDSA